MFDLAWSEIALIGVVALIAIGPKDMPVAIKAVAEMVKKARRMASEFQTHVDEMVREANLHEVRDQINDIRSMDIKGKILGAVDSDGSIRRTINERPYNPSPPPVTPVVPADAAAAPHEPAGVAASDPGAPVPPINEAVPHEAATLVEPPTASPAYVDPRGTPPALPAQHETATHSAPHV
jgi:sec-independent protein translocase protein TatB